MNYRRANPATLLRYRERYRSYGPGRSFLNARLQLVGRHERQIAAVQTALDILRRRIARTGHARMQDFSDRIANVWGQVGSVLGPAIFIDDVLAHLERLLFYLDIIGDAAADGLSAWDWLVGQATEDAYRAICDLRQAVGAA